MATNKPQSLLTHHFTVKRTHRQTEKSILKGSIDLKRNGGKHESISSKRKYDSDDEESGTTKTKCIKVDVKRDDDNRKKQIRTKLAALLASRDDDNVDLTISESLKSVIPKEDDDRSLEIDQTLTQKIPTLTLPHKYEILNSMFSAVEAAVSMMHNRNESCAFFKVKKSVQQITRKNFDLHHLAQINFVYPECYEFAYEKSNVYNYEYGIKKGDYHLVLTPAEDQKRLEKFLPSVMVKRRKMFSERLLIIVKDHHEVFLRTLDPPITIDRDKLSRWHPRFNLERIPEISTKALPQPPDTKPVLSAKQVLEKCRGLYGAKIDAALEMVARKAENSTNSSVGNAQKLKTSSALKGIPQALIDRIRAKEAVRMQLHLTGSTQSDKRQAMIKRLPEIARILRTVFIAENKSALTSEKVIKKLQDSMTSILSPLEIEAHLRLIGELLPEWLLIIELKKAVYVKIDKDTDLNIILDKIKQHS